MTTSTVDDTMLDEEWLAAPRKRSRLRLVMVASLIASVCFLGGALAQKHLGADEAAASGLGGLPAGVPEGFGDGGFPAGGFPETAPQGTGTASAEAEGGADSEDQVIATVIRKKGDVWVVEDLGGTRHEVTVADDTEVVREVELTPAKVKAGDRVQITGAASGDELRATDITVR